MEARHPPRTVDRMTANGPTEAYEYEASKTHWEQPSFGPSDSPVSGTVLPAGSTWTAHAASAVARPSLEEDRLRTIVRLVWPIAIVLAITTGHWLPLLVAAIVVGAILRRRLSQLRSQRYQRLVAAPTLR